jgi:hypothetical protein
MSCLLKTFHISSRSDFYSCTSSSAHVCFSFLSLQWSASFIVELLCCRMDENLSEFVIPILPGFSKKWMRLPC